MEFDPSTIIIYFMITIFVVLFLFFIRIIKKIIGYVFTGILMFFIFFGLLFFGRKKSPSKEMNSEEIPKDLITPYNGEVIDFTYNGVIVELIEKVEFIYNDCIMNQYKFIFYHQPMWEAFCNQHPDLVTDFENIRIFELKKVK